MDEKAQRTLDFALQLQNSGNYWVFKVLDKQWEQIFAHYLWEYFPDETDEEDEFDPAYFLGLEDYDMYFISKEYVLSPVLAEILGCSVASIYDADVIVLGKLDFVGDPDAKSNVSYFGTA